MDLVASIQTSEPLESPPYSKGHTLTLKTKMYSYISDSPTLIRSRQEFSCVDPLQARGKCEALGQISSRRCGPPDGRHSKSEAFAT